MKIEDQVYLQYQAVTKELAYAKRYAKYHEAYGPVGYMYGNIEWLESRHKQLHRRLTRLKSKYVTYQRLQEPV